jgi:hypothetical protein
MVRRWFVLVILVLALPLAGYAQKGHAKEVQTDSPQPEIFLQPVKYVAHTGSLTVIFRFSCVDENSQPIPNCVELTSQPDRLDYRKDNVLSVVIPGKSVRNLLAMVPRFGPNIHLENRTEDWDAGWFTVNLTTTLESPALLDPRAVYPDTGEPMNGKVEAGLSARSVTTVLPPGAPFTDYLVFTRHGYIGRQWFRDNFKLPEDLIDKFFDNPITVRVNIYGSAKLAIDSSVYVGILFEGN